MYLIQTRTTCVFSFKSVPTDISRGGTPPLDFSPMSLDYVNKILLPGGGRKYSGTHSKGLIWLKNEAGHYFPNHLIRKGTKSILLYSHGNGGSLGDFKSITFFYAQWFNTSVFAIEYPSYGPAEGTAGEESVNDNLRTAFNFLLFLGYPPKNIILMGYSIGTGPSIQLASELCLAGTPPGALVTVAAYLSICDIVRDLKGSLNMISGLLAGVIDNRWDSATRITSVTCPSLFVHGEFDEVIPCKHSETLFEKCASHVKRLRVCPRADHTHFEEPGDTVDPIAGFLAESFRPDTTAQIIQIPARFSMCPQSILDREALVKQKDATTAVPEVGFQGCADSGSESSCFNFYDMLNWVAGYGPSSVVDADQGETAKDKLNGSPGLSSLFQQNSPRDDVRKSDGDNETDSMAGAKSVGGAISYTGESSSEVSATVSISASSQGQGQGHSSSSVIPSANALKVLRGYYEAFNNHNIPAAVGYLAKDISVTFPDSKKNWSSSSAAFDRYTTMFRKSPHLKGKFSLLDISNENSRTSVTVYCHFTCSPSGVNTVREMVYVIENDLIQIIHNKY